MADTIFKIKALLRAAPIATSWLAASNLIAAGIVPPLLDSEKQVQNYLEVLAYCSFILFGTVLFCDTSWTIQDENQHAENSYTSAGLFKGRALLMSAALAAFLSREFFQDGAEDAPTAVKIIITLSLMIVAAVVRFYNYQHDMYPGHMHPQEHPLQRQRSQSNLSPYTKKKALGDTAAGAFNWSATGLIMHRALVSFVLMQDASKITVDKIIVGLLAAVGGGYIGLNKVAKPKLYYHSKQAQICLSETFMAFLVFGSQFYTFQNSLSDWTKWGGYISALLSMAMGLVQASRYLPPLDSTAYRALN